MFNDWKINYLYLYLYLYSNKKLPIQYKKVGTGIILKKKLKCAEKNQKTYHYFGSRESFNRTKCSYKIATCTGISGEYIFVL